MGRKIRRVVPNWNHPKVVRRWGEEDYQPIYDKSFCDVLDTWNREKLQWDNKTHKDYSASFTYEEWAGDIPNDPSDYRPDWKEEDMTWYQLYETVSEGTPVTPPFATKQELIDYLVVNGDFWDQGRKQRGWNREAAEYVVNGGYAPSMMVMRNTDGSVTVETPKTMSSL